MDLNDSLNQVKALAGVFQACDLVKQIAWTGQCSKAPMFTAFSSIFKQNPNDVDDVYGDPHNLTHGFNVLVEQLTGGVTGDKKQNTEVTRYAVNIIHLQKKLSRRQEMQTQIADGISQVKLQLQHFELDHPNILAHLADIYQQTISKFGPRVLVNGEHIHLSNKENTNKIRALLLAGIRSAVLFQQCKGSKFKLLLKRKTYLELATQLSG